jgi:hypothetical protein
MSVIENKGGRERPGEQLAQGSRGAAPSSLRAALVTVSRDGIRGMIWYAGDQERECWAWQCPVSEREEGRGHVVRALVTCGRPASMEEIAKSLWRLAGSPGRRPRAQAQRALASALRELWYAGRVVRLVGDRGETLWAMPDGETAGLPFERDPNVSRDLLVLCALIRVENSTRVQPNPASLVRDAMSDHSRPVSSVVGQALGRCEKRGWVEKSGSVGRNTSRLWKSTEAGRASAREAR